MKIKNIMIIAGALLVVAGCAQTPPKQEVNLHYVAAEHAPAEMANQDAQVQIAEAASSVGKSLQQLSSMQMAVTPKVPLTEIDAKATGMTERASLDWNGPIQPLLEQIARATGYKVKVLGEAPAIAVVVSISAHNEVMADILRNATYQVQNKATIKVIPATKVIELRYHRV